MMKFTKFSDQADYDAGQKTTDVSEEYSFASRKLLIET